MRFGFARATRGKKKWLHIKNGRCSLLLLIFRHSLLQIVVCLCRKFSFSLTLNYFMRLYEQHVKWNFQLRDFSSRFFSSFLSLYLSLSPLVSTVEIREIVECKIEIMHINLACFGLKNDKNVKILGQTYFLPFIRIIYWRGSPAETLKIFES